MNLKLGMILQVNSAKHTYIYMYIWSINVQIRFILKIEMYKISMVWSPRQNIDPI